MKVATLCLVLFCIISVLGNWIPPISARNYFVSACLSSESAYFRRAPSLCPGDLLILSVSDTWDSSPSCLCPYHSLVESPQPSCPFRQIPTSEFLYPLSESSRFAAETLASVFYT